jgi:hypothetical protein
MIQRSDNDTKDIYHIRIRGTLDQRWSDWFDGFEITYRGGNTILEGAVLDQPALHGILAKIRNLGLTILLVENVDLEVEDHDEE